MVNYFHLLHDLFIFDRENNICSALMIEFSPVLILTSEFT